MSDNKANMRHFLDSIHIKVPESAYLKDPEGSELGKKILEHAILQLDEFGLETFNFKKLAEATGSTEASIYRYFENKHKLLLYVTSWYWAWLDYQLAFATANLPAGEEKLQRAIQILIQPSMESNNYQHLDIFAVKRIAVSESSKSYFTRSVDEDNKKKLFLPYKALIGRLANIFSEISSDFSHPHSLATTVLEAILHQSYFRLHLPSLNDIGEDENLEKAFFVNMCLGTINRYSEQ